MTADEIRNGAAFQAVVRREYEYCSVCPQWISYSLNCKWFRNAVLQRNRDLESAILKKPPQKHCSVCGRPIYAAANRTKYCPVCSLKESRRRDAERKRKAYWSLHN